ncbi:MAG TPA: division/cell wall cluster transcriptional repressor MraZ [Stellaceae bacterium]|nr:division/cell wall cluster transcriptional repressor MraZ [Stellaceae bacterium]
MAVFLSTYINKVDRKGRVSVPAPFRAVLAASSKSGIVAFRALKLGAIEVGGLERIEELLRRLDRLPEMSDDREALSAFISDARPLAFDGEGRVMLPDDLTLYAGITDSAAFVGRGFNFQIWEPARFQRHDEEMRARIRERGLTLPPPAEGQ